MKSYIRYYRQSSLGSKKLFPLLLTSVVKGSRKAMREGAAGRGRMYKMEMPRLSQGMVKAKASARLDVMEMSAITKSATPSATSPSMPFQFPGDVSLPYYRNPYKWLRALHSILPCRPPPV